MLFREIIFSNQALYRLARHLMFWLVYTTFFYLQSITPEVITVLYHSNAFYFAWVSVCCYLPSCILSVYIFLYFILPLYLQKKKFIQALIVIMLFYVLFNLVDYYMAILFFETTCNCDVATLKPITVFGYGNNNAFLAIAIGCFATGIKFVKEWYLQRKQVLQMENERVEAELHSLKTSIQPDFLFQSLQSVKKNIEAGTAQSPKMILQLSDVLSYLLYDCNTDFISLYQELSAVKKYILLEENKTSYEFSVDITLKEGFKNVLIVPSTLLSFLQHCFVRLNEYAEKAVKIKVECSLQTTEFFFLFSIYDVQEMKLLSHLYSEEINNFKYKIERFYTNNHFLNVDFLNNSIETTLKLTLSKFTSPAKIEQLEKNITASL